MRNHVLTSIVICLIITSCVLNESTATPASTFTLTSISTSTSIPSVGDHFPQLISTPNVHYDLSVMGELVLENGCLRVSGVKWSAPGRDSLLLIWDARFSTRTYQGTVQVVDSITGNVLANVGDFVEVGYDGDLSSRTWKPIPKECSKPYMVVGETIKKVERPSLGARFPQLINPQSAPKRTAIKGNLVLENGCLRINGVEGTVNGNSFLLIWNLKYSTFTQQEIVQVVNGDTDKVLASTGDVVGVGGGFIEDPEAWGLIESLPEECSGPYFLVGVKESIKKIDKP